MAHPEDGGNGLPEGALSLQRLFYGACSLIVILGGVTWGLVSANHSEEVDRNQRTNETQWSRIRELNDTLIELKSKHADIRKDVDDQETRIRALEHKGDRR